MTKIFNAGLTALIISTANAAPSSSESLEVISPQVQKLLGTWKGDVVFNNEHRYWIIVKKRDYSAHYEFKVCDINNENCKEWEEEGAWNADENFFYSIFTVDENGNPEGFVYKYEILDNGCVDYLMVATSFKEHTENSGKTYDADDYVNNYRFSECKVH